MGNFYENHVVAGVPRDEVLRRLRAAGRTAWVGPAGGGHVVVATPIDEPDMTAGDVLSPGGRVLSGGVYDDDLLVLRLSEDGTCAGRCAAGAVEMAGELPGPTLTPEAIAAAFGGDVSAVGNILAADHVFMFQAHLALLETLGLPTSAAGSGYDHLADDIEEGEVDGEWTHVP